MKKQFSIQVDAPESNNGIPVVVEFVGLKNNSELGALSNVFNLDVYGGTNGNRIKLGHGHFHPEITVYTTKELVFADADGSWLTHDDLVAAGAVSEMVYDSFSKKYSFYIYEWPSGDRMCGAY